jgi:hypothetical protein
MSSNDCPITIRAATALDRAAIMRIAQRDTRGLPPEPVLVAERAGEVQAALSLRTGGIVADPFRRTAELVALLRLAGSCA